MVSVDELKEKDNVIVKKDQLIQSLLEEKQKKEDLINEQNSLIKLYRAKFGELKGVEVEEVDENAAKKTKEDIRSNTKDEMDLQYDKVIERDELSQPEQIAAHKEAEQVVREKLEADGYDCSNWVVEDDDLSTFKKWHSVNQVDNIISPDGERINLVIKSAKGGYIFLSATDFEFLTSNCNNVLMVWDGRNVHSVSAEDIFKKDSNVNLVFDTEYTPKHYYAALSKVFQYIKRTTFAVKCPSYNAYDAIKSFGMDSKTEGVQELFDDNDL